MTNSNDKRVSKLHCIKCGLPGTSVERTNSYDQFIIRERACSRCGHVFTTVERPDPLPSADLRSNEPVDIP